MTRSNNIRPAMYQDLLDVGSNLREMDRLEIQHATGREDVLVSVARSLDMSWEPMAYAPAERTALAIFGVAGKPGPGQAGIPWMLATGELRAHANDFLRHSITVVKAWKFQYDALGNYIWLENKASIRWLHWLGFQFDKPFPLENGALFQRFHWSKEDVQC